MNEKQWLGATDPRGGIDYLCSPEVSANRRKAGRRKLRLFLCACSRRVWHLVPEGPHREAVELGERLCEGENLATQIASLKDREVQGKLSRRHAAHAGLACVGTNIWHAAVTGADAAAMAVAWASVEDDWEKKMKFYDQAKDAEEVEQAKLLREIAGNPFRPVKVEPAWLRWNDRTVVAMAQSIYEDRAFNRLPILHDALLDAGCDNEEILSHCCGPGPHTRGCWPVDLILGKS